MVDFAFFESLGPSEAENWLADYLATGADTASELVNEAVSAGLDAHWSVEDLPEVMAWVVGRLTTVPTDEDFDLPAWIRESDTYRRGLYRFDAISMAEVMTLSFYLGESFVRSFPEQLAWGTGNQDYAQAKQPVVAGFVKDLELATIMVTENLCRAALEAEPARIRTAVDKWRGFVPT